MVSSHLPGVLLSEVVWVKRVTCSGLDLHFAPSMSFKDNNISTW